MTPETMAGPGITISEMCALTPVAFGR
jgi:hypothetical protein